MSSNEASNTVNSPEASAEKSLTDMLTALLQEARTNTSLSQDVSTLTTNFPDLYLAVMQGPAHPKYPAIVQAISDLYKASIAPSAQETPKTPTPEEKAQQLLDDYWAEYGRLLTVNQEPPEHAPFSVLQIDLSKVTRAQLTADYFTKARTTLLKKFHPDRHGYLKSEQVSRMMAAVSRNINAACDELSGGTWQQERSPQPSAGSTESPRSARPDQTAEPHLDYYRRQLKFLDSISRISNAFSLIFPAAKALEFQTNEHESYVKIQKFILAVLGAGSSIPPVDTLSLTLTSDRGKELLLSFLRAIQTENSQSIQGSLSPDQTVLSVSFDKPK